MGNAHGRPGPRRSAVVVAVVVAATASACTGSRVTTAPTTHPEATAVATSGPLARCGQRAWVSAFSASPSDARGGQPRTPASGVELQDTTIRQVYVLHAPGSELRLHLSNTLSPNPLVIDRVTVARDTGDGSIDPTTSRDVGFAGGAPGVQIAAGGETLSAPVTYAVSPGDRVSVSMWVRSAPAPTDHGLGLQTGFASSPGQGDRTGQPTAASLPVTFTARYVVDRIDTSEPRYGGLVVAVGDSITDGDGKEPLVDRDARYPDQLQRLLTTRGSGLAVTNAGIAANQVTATSEAIFWGGPGLVTRFGHDVLDQPGVSGVVVLAGINDLGLSGAAADTVTAGLAQVAAQARAAGVQAEVGTLLPMAGAAYDSAAVQHERAAVNDWIRSQTVFDGVVDFDRALHDPASPTALLPADDSGDHLHPSAQGYAVMAQVAAAAPWADCGTTPGQHEAPAS